MPPVLADDPDTVTRRTKDAAPPSRGLTWSSRGGGAVLHLGDALEILASTPEESVDCVWTDPPYLLSNGGVTCVSGRMVSVDKGDWDRSRGIEADHAFNLEWTAACRRVLKPTGTIWVSGTLHVYPSVGMALVQNGFRLLNDIVWEKPNPPPNLGCRTFTHSTEVILWASKAGKGSRHRYTFNYDEMRRENDGKQMKTVWRMKSPSAAEKRFGKHPTQKPLGAHQKMPARQHQRRRCHPRIPSRARGARALPPSSSAAASSASSSTPRSSTSASSVSLLTSSLHRETPAIRYAQCRPEIATPRPSPPDRGYRVPADSGPGTRLSATPRRPRAERAFHHVGSRPAPSAGESQAPPEGRRAATAMLVLRRARADQLHEGLSPAAKPVSARDRAGSGGVAAAPVLDVLDALVRVGDVGVAPRHVAEVVPVRPFVMVAHAVFGDDGAESVAETVVHGGADAAARHAAGDDDGVHPLLDEVGSDGGVEEDRSRALADPDVVVRVVDAGVELGAGMAVDEGLAYRPDLPSRASPPRCGRRCSSWRRGRRTWRAFSSSRCVFSTPRKTRGAPPSAYCGSVNPTW